MKLWAISDLHLSSAENRDALLDFPHHSGDWLILAGDLGERPEHLDLAFTLLGARFARLIWVPGNHELWTIPSPDGGLRGQAKYEAMLAVCRRHGVCTPEDPYPVWTGPGGPCLIAPLFLLYDYSFAPTGLDPAGAVAWAAEARIRSGDEILLSPYPRPSRVAWCHQRVAWTEKRLTTERPPGLPTILVNHFPLRQDVVDLPRIPRFSPWCGTRLTEGWHRRFDAVACVHGHLHRPATHWRDGVRFEEVSAGYPRQWLPRGRHPATALRRILPHDGAGR